MLEHVAMPSSKGIFQTQTSNLCFLCLLHWGWILYHWSTWEAQARILEWVAMSSSRESPKPGIEPRSPALQADSLSSEPPGKLFNSYHINIITFFGWRPAFAVVVGGSFHLPHDLFHSILLYSIHFSSPSQFVLKMEHLCYVLVENHMWKYGQEGFFFFNLCGTQTSLI